jgi:hypothetical protein
MSEMLRVGAARLAGLHNRAVMASGPEACWSRVSAALPALDAQPLDPAGEYAHKVASLELPGLRVAVGLGTSFRFEVDDHGLNTFLLSCGGRASVRQGGVLLQNSPDMPGLFLPGEAYHCQIRNAHGYVISTTPERLAASALAMAEASGLDGVDLSLLQRPMVVGPTHPSTAHVLSLLRSTLQLLDQQPTVETHSAETQGLQLTSLVDVICRQLCALMIPALINPRST